MHVLVATDGSLDPAAAATFALSLAGPKGTTTVATIVRVPRTMLADLRAQFGSQPPPVGSADVEYVGTIRAESPTPRSWPGDDAIVARYLGDKRIERCRPIVTAIREGGGTAESIVREGDDVADDLIALINEIEASVIIVGARAGATMPGLLWSIGAKLVRRSPCPVLVLR